MSNTKVLVFGSNGLVGNSVSRILNDSSKVGKLYLSQRSDTDLEDKSQIEKKISEIKPDIIIKRKFVLRWKIRANQLSLCLRKNYWY